MKSNSICDGWWDEIDHQIWLATVAADHMPCSITDGPQFDDDDEPDLEALTEHAEYMAELRRDDDLYEALRDIASDEPEIRRTDFFADQAE